MQASSDELIDGLRKSFENPTEWKRRRAFLQLNFNGLPFDRLVCLSHCFVNSSMHGAVYPSRVMEEVEQYSRSIDGYALNGGGGNSGAHASSGDRNSAHGGHKRSRAAGDADGRTGGRGGGGEPPWKRPAPPPLDLDAQLNAAAAAASAAATAAAAPESIALSSDLDLADFYLREIETDDPSNACNPANVLKCSADFCHRTLEYQFEALPSGGAFRCRLMLDGRPAAEATGPSKLDAKAAVSSGVLAALRSRCWTLVVRSDRAFIRAQADAGFARPDAATAAASGESADKIGSDNVGHRLLLGMGWSGAGGLGKRLDGLAEPPCAGDVRVVSRAGLGAGADSTAANAAAGAAFQSAVGRVLRDFQRDPEDRDDLFFAADFSNEERRHVHSQCLRLGLASRSYGAADGVRCLVVSRKRSAAQLVEFVRRNGGSTVRYRLVPPGDGGAAA